MPYRRGGAARRRGIASLQTPPRSSASFQTCDASAPAARERRRGGRYRLLDHRLEGLPRQIVLVPERGRQREHDVAGMATLPDRLDRGLGEAQHREGEARRLGRLEALDVGVQRQDDVGLRRGVVECRCQRDDGLDLAEALAPAARRGPRVRRIALAHHQHARRAADAAQPRLERGDAHRSFGAPRDGASRRRRTTRSG